MLFRSFLCTYLVYLQFQIKKLKKQHKQVSDTCQEFTDNYPKLYAEYQKLHKDMKVNLEKIQNMKLSKTQKEYQKELDKQYLDHYSATKTDFAEKLAKQKKDFDAKLEEEYESSVLKFAGSAMNLLSPRKSKQPPDSDKTPETGNTIISNRRELPFDDSPRSPFEEVSTAKLAIIKILLEENLGVIEAVNPVEVNDELFVVVAVP